MITADVLKTLTSFTPYALARALHNSGYTGASFKTAEFTGITNGRQFAYTVIYYDDNGLGEQKDKVFLSYDTVDGRITAEY